MARITLMPKRNGTYALTVRYLPKDQSLAFNMQVRGENGITTDEVDLYAPNAGVVELQNLRNQINAYLEARGVDDTSEKEAIAP